MAAYNTGAEGANGKTESPVITMHQGY